MDQLRADLLCDLLLTGMPAIDATRSDDGPGSLGAIRAHVQITIPATVLLGADAPADLVGHCPIDAEAARTLAAQARGPWERVIIHPVTGVVLHTDTYQRTAAMDRHLKARDGHCRFPGCRIPRSGARSTTPSTGRAAARPTSATSPISVSGTTR